MDYTSSPQRHSMDYSSSGSLAAPAAAATPNRHSTGTMLGYNGYHNQQHQQQQQQQQQPHPHHLSQHNQGSEYIPHHQAHSSLSNIIIPEEPVLSPAASAANNLLPDLSSLNMASMPVQSSATAAHSAMFQQHQHGGSSPSTRSSFRSSLNPSPSSSGLAAKRSSSHGIYLDTLGDSSSARHVTQHPSIYTGQSSQNNPDYFPVSGGLPSTSASSAAAPSPYSPYSPMSITSPSTPKTAKSQPWSVQGSPIGGNGIPTARTSPQKYQPNQSYVAQHSPSASSSSQKHLYAHSSPRPPQTSMSTALHHQSSATQLRPAKGSMSPQLISANNNIVAVGPGVGNGPFSPIGISPNISAPTFRHIRYKSEIPQPRLGPTKYRRALPEGGFMSPVSALTVHLSSTYHICNPAFSYQSSKNPRRVLTKPSESKLNNGHDNSESDYILYVNDILGTDEQRRYLVLDILGKGTFGQVVKCQNMINKEIVAVKIIKNNPAYLNQSMMEVSILEHLNNNVDRNDEHHLLRLKDRFMHKEHLCLVFELLNSNLYELIKQNQFRGLSTNLVRVFAHQLLDSLMVLKEARLIHCDLKPENILLKSVDSPTIKVIDFGSACHERQTVYSYIQSRFYRSPEVILGLPYTSSIDMWSLGCIVAELFLGLPIFPGTSEYNQLSRIIESLGNPPNWMIEMGKNSGQFMEKYVDEYGRKHYRLKSREKYCKEFNTDEQPSKEYFPSSDLRKIIMDYPLPRKNLSQADIDREMQNRVSFADFVLGLLNLNPFERWTPHQAANHPFIRDAKFDHPYVPSSSAKEEVRPQRQTVVPPSLRSGGGMAAAPSTTNPMVTSASMNINTAQPVSHHVTQPVYSTSIPAIHVSQANGHKPVAGPVASGYYAPQQVAAPSGNYKTASDSLSQHLPPQAGNVAEAQYLSSFHAPPVPQQRTQYQQSRRPRATTIGQLDSIPGPIQRAGALINPTQSIRAQASPAYIPPPDLFGQNISHQVGNKNFAAYSGPADTNEVVQNLENGLFGA